MGENEYYVVGFRFDIENDTVALIRKNRPEWQAGRLNGIGGKVEGREHAHPEVAMSREFEEETGHKVPPSYWIPFAQLNLPLGHGVVFCYYSLGSLEGLKSVTDEEIVIKSLNDFGVVPGPDMMNNLPWLIALALNRMNSVQKNGGEFLDFAVVEYVGSLEEGADN